MQLLVQGHEDGAQATFGVGAKHAESLAFGRRGADGIAGGAVGLAVGRARRRSRAEMGQGALDVVVADLGQALAGRAAGLDGGQALLSRAAVLLDMPLDKGLDGGSVLGVEVAAGGEVVRHGARLIASPGAEGGDESVLIDQTVLEREESEKEVAVDGNRVHEWETLVVFRDRPAPSSDGPDRRSPAVDPSFRGFRQNIAGPDDPSIGHRARFAPVRPVRNPNVNRSYSCGRLTRGDDSPSMFGPGLPVSPAGY